MGNSRKYNKVCKKIKRAERYAQENGITYMNFETLREKIHLDYEVDFADWEHLNVNGTRKTTSYMGKYLAQQYQLEDHRNDLEFANWNSDYKDYESYIRKKMKQDFNKV